MEENITQTEIPQSVNEGTDIMLQNWTNKTLESVIVSEDVDPHEDIVRMIQVFARPPVIAIGTIGNVLAFVTMRRGSLKHISTCFYMAILGLADTGEFSLFTNIYYHAERFIETRVNLFYMAILGLADTGEFH